MNNKYFMINYLFKKYVNIYILAMEKDLNIEKLYEKSINYTEKILMLIFQTIYSNLN